MNRSDSLSNMMAEELSTAGLLIPGLYIAAAFLCTLVGMGRRPEFAYDAPLWILVAVGYLLMAASLLVGGDEIFVDWMRGLARSGHWYQERRPLQLLVILVLLVMSAMVFQRVFREVADWPTLNATVRWLVISTTACLVVVGLRYVSYHDTDTLLNFEIAGWRVSGLIEVGGGLVSIAVCLKEFLEGQANV